SRDLTDGAQLHSQVAKSRLKIGMEQREVLQNERSSVEQVTRKRLLRICVGYLPPFCRVVVIFEGKQVEPVPLAHRMKKLARRIGNQPKILASQTLAVRVHRTRLGKTSIS